MPRTMNSAILPLLFGLCLPGAALPAQQTIKGRLLTDKTAGFQLTLPSHWQALPINVDEQRRLAFFQSERFFRAPRKGRKFGKPQRAFLRVVKLDKPVENKANYDFLGRLKRRHGKRKYAAKPVAGTLDGMQVRKWDIKLTGKGDDPLRILAWEFVGETHDYVVEFEMLETAVFELGGAARRSIQSFRFIEKAAQVATKTVDAGEYSRRQWLETPLLDRHARRKIAGEAYEKKILAKVPSGWTTHESKHFLIVSHTDAKVTKHVQAVLEAFYDWMEERFDSLSDDYPMRIVIRLCGSSTEYHSYRAGGWRAEHNFALREVTMANDRGNLNLKDVMWSVYHRYMLDESPEFYFNTPHWLRTALYGLFARARLKGRKLEFPCDAEELSTFVRLRQKGADPWSAAKLMSFPKFDGHNKVQAIQALTLLRFLDGPGGRSKTVGRNFLGRYAAAIQELVREWDAKDGEVMVWDSEAVLRERLDAARAKGEEKSAYIPKWNDRWERYEKVRDKRYAAFLQALYAKMPGWTEKQAAKVDRSYQRYARSKRR